MTPNNDMDAAPVDADRTLLGPVSDFAPDSCIAVCDDRAVVVSIGAGAAAELRVFPNECLHASQPLAGGVVSNGVLTCPHHFWRYDAQTGRLLGNATTGGTPSLEPYPAEIVDGQLYVAIPAPPAPQSTREMLLEHARTWKRDDAAQS